MTPAVTNGAFFPVQSPFKVWNRDIFRPLLQLSKADLLDYAETNKLVWLEDPSNKDGTYLRNWLREKWLPELEYRLPGAKANFAKDQLKSLVERVERLEEEKTALSTDLKEVYAEAKGQGFDTKIMRQVVRLRKMESHEREERDALLDLYLSALGMAS